MNKKIICKVCQKEFEVVSHGGTGMFQRSISPWNKKMCSRECAYKNGIDHARKQSEEKKKKVVERKCRQCNTIVVSTAYCPQNFCGGKYGECYKVFLSENRKGSKNPSYNHGLRSNKKIGTYTAIHRNACAGYRKEFLSKNDYLFCEVCGVNSNGTPRFEVHHLYFASLYPKHTELHNHKNLILICIQCHNDFHSNKNYDKFIELEESRGLKKLFASNNK